MDDDVVKMVRKDVMKKCGRRSFRHKSPLAIVDGFIGAITDEDFIKALEVLPTRFRP